MIFSHLRWLLLAGLLPVFGALASASAVVYGAEVVISQVVPIAISPASGNRVVLSGSFGAGAPRIWNSLGLTTRVIEHSKERVVIELDADATTSVGPFGLWLASDDGPSNLVTLVVDDLPLVVESNSNHALEQAQSMSIPSAVVAQCDGTQLDYFRIACRQGEPLRLEVVAQRLGSAMDPVVRLLDSQGKSLQLFDDMPGSTDCRGIFHPPATGEYTLVVQDNRFSGGSPYLLRVGDFPLLASVSPSVMSPFSTWVVPCGDQAGVANAISLRPFCKSSAPAGAWGGSHVVTIPVRRAEGKSSSWIRVGTSDLPVLGMSESGNQTGLDWHLPVPCGVSGVFETLKDCDTFILHANAGERLHFRVSTASLGFPTQLRLRVRDSEGKLLEQSPVPDGDEWSFSMIPKVTGRLQCDLTELLGRYGDEFAYYLEIRQGSGFDASIKFDANTRERASVESSKGGFAIDVAVERFGYDGPIRFSLANQEGLVGIANPVLPAGAKDVRLYLLTTPDASPLAMSHLRLLAEAADFNTAVASRTVSVSNVGLLRQKAPHQPFPYAFQSGGIPVAVVPTQPPYFKVPEPTPELKFLWNALEQKISLPIERLTGEFKSPIQVVVDSIVPTGCVVEPKVEGDLVTCNLRREKAGIALPAHVSLKVFAEFQNRVRWERITIPIESMKAPAAIPVLVPDNGMPPEPNTRLTTTIPESSKP